MSLERPEPSYFGAGPALLPTDVLQQVAVDLINYQNQGIGVGEISHRSGPAGAIIDGAKNSLKALLDIPDTHEVFFLQGGGTSGFSCVVYNMLAAFAKKTGKKGKADYFVTGAWSKKAYEEAVRLGCDAHIVADSRAATGKFGGIPDKKEWNFSPAEETAYVYYCDNETVGGVEFPTVPEVPAGVELVGDMSSNILSRKVDVSKFGLILAGAQKNVGIAGITIYIIKKSLLEHASEAERRALDIPLPPIAFDFPTVVKNNSAYNTIPILAVHVVKLVCEKLLQNGGLAKQEETSSRKAEKLYSALDKYPKVFQMVVDEPVRSRMNIVFTLKDGDTEALFLSEAAQRGLTGLKGHRSVGGIRVSNYNAVSEASIDSLVEFIESFAQKLEA